MPSHAALLFIFLDGVGIGSADPQRNPIFAARLPTLDGLLSSGRFGQSQPVGRSGSRVRPAVTYRALDATLGVSGLPQSGTGHASLLAGFNAPQAFGRHFGPWIPTPLRERFAAENMLQRAVSAGGPARFANAVPFTEGVRAFTKRPIGPPLAAHTAGLRIGGMEALIRGEAVASGFDNERWRSAWPDAGVPEVSVEEAGRRLGRIAGPGGLTLFAHYDLDLIGHRGRFVDAVRALERVDGFLAGVLQGFALDLGTLVITSDHGNIEDADGGHTRNPVPLAAVGREAERFIGCGSIADLADTVIASLTAGDAT